MTENTGGPAFPYPSYDEGRQVDQYPGMSLRDWFAGQALAGMLADSKVSDTVENLADLVYAMADAMLKERAK